MKVSVYAIKTISDLDTYTSMNQFRIIRIAYNLLIRLLLHQQLIFIKLLKVNSQSIATLRFASFTLRRNTIIFG